MRHISGVLLTRSGREHPTKRCGYDPPGLPATFSPVTCPRLGGLFDRRLEGVAATDGPQMKPGCSLAVDVSSRSVHRKRHWYDPKSIARSVAIQPRLYFSAVVGVVALVVLPGGWPASVREAIAWDLSAGIYLIL